MISLLSAFMLVGCAGGSTVSDDPIAILKQESERLNTLETYSVVTKLNGEAILPDANNEYCKHNMHGDYTDYYQNAGSIHYRTNVLNNPSNDDYIQLYRVQNGHETLLYCNTGKRNFRTI